MSPTRPSRSAHAAARRHGATLLDHTPEVRAFVAAVRRRLSRPHRGGARGARRRARGRHERPGRRAWGRGASRPGGYAAELRSAAGFSPEAALRHAEPCASGSMAWLDRGSNTLEPLGGHRRPSRAAAVRELAATGLVGAAGARWPARCSSRSTRRPRTSSASPSTGRSWRSSSIFLSVQLGRGVWWPAALFRRSLVLRIALIGLNVFAIIAAARDVQPLHGRPPSRPLRRHAGLSRHPDGR